MFKQYANKYSLVWRQIKPNMCQWKIISKLDKVNSAKPYGIPSAPEGVPWALQGSPGHQRGSPLDLRDPMGAKEGPLGL